MEWKEAAPWVLVGISVMGQLAHLAVAQWRIGALDKWREDVDDRLREFQQAKGESFARHEDHERRLGRIERRQDRDED